ncbi:transcriptional regulator PtsJ [Kerstersia similis]|uniref:MocR-like B6 salvage transcription factor PtsJ n=1 Tax=Kerstersia similis TaxID=206505 RepID=UPI0039EFB0B8
MSITGKTVTSIFESIRLQVQAGQLQPGQVLPPVRDLAVTLGVNRNTVAAVYKKLAIAGLATTQGRRGTVIREQLDPGEQEGWMAGTPLVDLASGNPNPAWLPDINQALARRPYQHQLYGSDPVHAELASYGQQWLGRDCPGDYALDVTHGAVDAIERLLAAYLVAGDKVAVEDPCFLSSINTLRIAGLQAVGVPMDSDGMRPEALEQALEQGAQAVIVTPRAHNPTGCSLTSARAQALQEVLARYPHVLVIVDDHFALLAYKRYWQVVPASSSRWALVRSVSKALGPDLRLALVASDPQTSQRLRLRLAPGTGWVSHLLQEVAVACLQVPALAGRMGLATQEYCYRRNILKQALAAQGVAVAEPVDGLNLWIPLPEPTGQADAALLARHGWLVRSGDVFGVQAPACGLRVTISALHEDQVERLAADIGKVLRKRHQ